MTVIEDLKNELYALDNSRWYDNLAAILEILHFPHQINYVCEIDEFLYDRSGKLKRIGYNDRQNLNDCLFVAEYGKHRSSRGARLFGIKISGNRKLRNEKVYHIYRLFVKMYGSATIVVFVDSEEIAFAGMGFNMQNHAEMILSEWFSYADDYEKLNKLAEIDFSMSMGEYIWSISREYVRYRESKMYLLFGCENPITYDALVDVPGSVEPVWITKVDREETIQVNSEHYPRKYEWDYFVDDRDVEIETEDFMADEDEVDFEWTMLEMELASEVEAEDTYYGEDEEEFIAEEYDEELSGLNPEEMLKYIRGRK